MPNFYTLRSAPYASKLSLNLLVQKLLIKMLLKLTPGVNLCVGFCVWGGEMRDMGCYVIGDN